MPPRSASLSTDITLVGRLRPSQVPGVSTGQVDGQPRAYCRPVSTAANDRVLPSGWHRSATGGTRRGSCGWRSSRRSAGSSVSTHTPGAHRSRDRGRMRTAGRRPVPAGTPAPDPAEVPDTVNRWTTLDAPVAVLQAATDGQPEPSRIWRELLVGYGVSDVASVVFRDRFGCWAFLDLWRIGAEHPFAPRRTPSSRASLPVTTALRGARPAPSRAAPAQGRRGPVGPRCCRPSSRCGSDPETEEYLRVLVPPKPTSTDTRRRLQRRRSAARRRGRGRRPPGVARVHLAGGAWLTSGRPSLEPAPTAEQRHRRHDRGHRRRSSGRLFARARGLTRPRGRAARPPGHRLPTPAHRRADVPLRAHSPGPPQVDLRQDLNRNRRTLLARGPPAADGRRRYPATTTRPPRSTTRPRRPAMSPPPSSRVSRRFVATDADEVAVPGRQMLVDVNVPVLALPGERSPRSCEPC